MTAKAPTAADLDHLRGRLDQALAALARWHAEIEKERNMRPPQEWLDRLADGLATDWCPACGQHADDHADDGSCPIHDIPLDDDECPECWRLDSAAALAREP